MDNQEQVCPWALNDALYRQYHDTEWGVPIHDDRLLFELLILEGMQAGLSWLTILRKRENFRRAFDGFDPASVAGYDDAKKAALLADAGIIRNHRKIEAAIGNARAFLQIQAEFGSFDRYYWAFAQGQPIVNNYQTLAAVPSRTDLSDLISRDLQKRGFKFAGSTIIYAFMQSTGMVCDHLTGCPCHPSFRTNQEVTE